MQRLVGALLLLCALVASVEKQCDDPALSGGDAAVCQDEEASFLQTKLTTDAKAQEKNLEATRVKRPECAAVNPPPDIDLVKLKEQGAPEALWRYPKFVYAVAITDDSKTNPFAWKYASKYNFREVWVTGGFVEFFQESGAPDADWVKRDMRQLNESTCVPLDFHAKTGDPHFDFPLLQPPELRATFRKNRKLACDSPGGCLSSLWHVSMFEGYPLYLNWCCATELVGNEVFYEGPVASEALMKYARDKIVEAGGGMENYPIVRGKTSQNDAPCPWQNASYTS